MVLLCDKTGKRAKKMSQKQEKEQIKTHVYCHDQVIMNELYKI